MTYQEQIGHGMVERRRVGIRPDQVADLHHPEDDTDGEAADHGVEEQADQFHLDLQSADTRLTVAAEVATGLPATSLFDSVAAAA